MRLKLVILGDDYRIRIVPETEGDKMLLEFVDKYDYGDLETEKENEYGYSQRKIKSIDIKLKIRPEEPNK